MRAILTFYNSEQYENEKEGISFLLHATERQIRFLKGVLESYLEDSNILHSRLHNDCGHDVFVCLKIEE